MIAGVARSAPPPSGAPRVLAALLDRSVEQISAAAADVRRFDRQAICTAADVWDNNLFPLFWAASTASPRERERRAAAVLRWMAGLGERRRQWMTEQAALAGHDVAPLLPPAEPYVPGRDYLGHVMAPQPRLTRQSVDELGPDYDLAAGSVRRLRVERAGEALAAHLEVVVPRGFAVEDGAPPALLDVWLDGVTGVAFDGSDTAGVVLDADAPGIAVSLGARGGLRAARGEFRLDDRSWHLSSAGRRADAVTPPRTAGSDRRRPPPRGLAGADAHAAAAVLHWAMLEIRSVRYAGRADRVPVTALCRAFSGAGEAVLAAGSLRGSRRPEAAFRAVVGTWAERGGPELAPWLARTLTEHAGRPDLAADPGSPAEPAPVPDPGPPPYAHLVSAAWSAAYTDHGRQRPARAELQLALPPRPDAGPAAPWRLRTVGCTGPEAFRLDTAAFRGEGPLVQTGTPTGACRIDLHGGALLASAAKGWSDGGRLTTTRG